MLLPRVVAHLRKQEWTAIAIDFVIVVTGVFVGLQVSNWNETRKAHAAEAQLLERLHQDVVLAEELIGSNRERRPQRVIDLTAAYERITGDGDAPLTPEECSAIATSFSVSTRIPLLPTLGLLQAGPGYGSITDPDLRASIAALSQGVEQIDDYVSKELGSNVEPSQAFPDLIALSNYVDENGELRVSAVCDLQNMRTNQRFLNALALNRDFQDSLSFRVAPVLAAFSELHVDLDRVLEIQHGGTSQ
jgi:hypothetical protein